MATIDTLEEEEIMEDAPLLEGDLNDIDRKKAEQEAREKQERERIIKSDYYTHIRNISDLERMTSTKTWKVLWEKIQFKIREHAEDALIIDQSAKDIIAHQQGVHVLRSVGEWALSPFDEFNKFIDRHGDIYLREIGLSDRAEFDSDTGLISLI